MLGAAVGYAIGVIGTKFDRLYRDGKFALRHPGRQSLRFGLRHIGI